MLLIDNIYYLFCCLLRKDKKAQKEDSWRVIGGGIIGAMGRFWAGYNASGQIYDAIFD